MKAEWYFNNVSIEIEKRSPSIVSSRRASRRLYKKYVKKNLLLDTIDRFYILSLG